MMKGKYPYAEALVAALSLRAKLQPYCDRIEVAGSIRRRCEMVGDIELVGIPTMRIEQGLFGPVGKGVSLLDEHLEKYPEIYRQVRAGDRLKELRFEGYQVDLFLTTPEQWGVIFTLRTGSADFSKWLVTDRQKGGGRMSCRYVNEGRVWRLVEQEAPFASPVREPMETPEERDVFEALGVDWVPLELRHRGYWSKTHGFDTPLRRPDPTPATPSGTGGASASETDEEKARDYV